MSEDTPRTDAEIQMGGYGYRHLVEADFARQLECELAAATKRAEVAECGTQASSYQAHQDRELLIETLKERDALAAQNVTLAKRVEEAEAECDKARTVADGWLDKYAETRDQRDIITIQNANLREALEMAESWGENGIETMDSDTLARYQQLKYFEPVPGFDRAKELAELREDRDRLISTFSHRHVNNGQDDACKQCGLDLRHQIHRP